MCETGVRHATYNTLSTKSHTTLKFTENLIYNRALSHKHYHGHFNTITDIIHLNIQYKFAPVNCVKTVILLTVASLIIWFAVYDIHTNENYMILIAHLHVIPIQGIGIIEWTYKTYKIYVINTNYLYTN